MPSSSPIRPQPPTKLLDTKGHLVQMVEPSFSTSCRARLQSGISPEWGSNKAKLGQFFDSRSRPSLTCLHDSSTDEENWTKLANHVSSHQKSWDISMKKIKRIANAATLNCWCNGQGSFYTRAQKACCIMVNDKSMQCYVLVSHVMVSHVVVSHYNLVRSCHNLLSQLLFLDHSGHMSQGSRVSGPKWPFVPCFWKMYPDSINPKSRKGYWDSFSEIAEQPIKCFCSCTKCDSCDCLFFITVMNIWHYFEPSG